MARIEAGMQASQIALVAALGGLAACVIHQSAGFSSPQNDYVSGAVFGASAVGASVVNRKITGDCYASCPTGTACNRETGMCDPICSCPADQTCERIGGEIVCVQHTRKHEGDVDGGGDAAQDAQDARP